jgi:hypothetical protein
MEKILVEGLVFWGGLAVAWVALVIELGAV